MTPRPEPILNAQADPATRSMVSDWIQAQGMSPVDVGSRDEFVAGLRRAPALVLLDAAWAEARGWLAGGALEENRPVVLLCGEVEGAAWADDFLPMPPGGPTWGPVVRAWLKAWKFRKSAGDRARNLRELADAMGGPAVLLGPRGEVLAANREAEELSGGHGSIGMPVGAYFADDEGTLAGLVSKGAWTGREESARFKKGGRAYKVLVARAGDPARPSGRMVMRWVAVGPEMTGGEEGDDRTRLDKLDRLEQDARLAAKLRAETPRMAGSGLKLADPDTFCSAMEGYEELLEQALERASYRDVPAGPLNEALGQLADQLGRSGASPRDMVELHGLALRRKCAGVPGARAKIYVDEGRYLILELLGRLAGYYRARAGFGGEVEEQSAPGAGS